ncbi:ATP-grasp domain-containing protein [Pseudomonas sp. NFACC02]|uniref:ATP-grasp domain-containing protein n=1 Tax=Pseudomonas sp. NFACC02 TaxID=1566250 RepID=UPI0008D5572F|nr:ATP-grasp domain-containing protein [Pseudomonas sp. NFACC02]SEQ54593.1 ATP-grasp domain-containing protein [Pseudomonas sp. NFACC02]
MNLIVIGRGEDCVDHAMWCKKMGHEVRYIVPEKIGMSVFDDADDIVSFSDSMQGIVEQLRISHRLPPRGQDAVNVLTDKVLFKSHPAVKPFVVQHIEIVPGTSKETAAALVNNHISFPVVVKPSNGFYSAGVVRAKTIEEFKRAYMKASRIGQFLAPRSSPARVIVEKYLDGNEFAVDGFVVGERIHPILIHRKRPFLEGPTFHESAYLTEYFDTSLGDMPLRMLEHIIGGLGLRNSAFHAEFRFDANGRLHVLEVAPRMAGSGATTQQLMAICVGLDAYECLHALGQKTIDLSPKHRGFGLEYDFGPNSSGTLGNVAKIALACENLGAARIIRYHSDGDVVLGPPNNVECILTAFFECKSLEAGEALFDHISNHYSIQTE